MNEALFTVRFRHREFPDQYFDLCDVVGTTDFIVRPPKPIIDLEVAHGT